MKLNIYTKNNDISLNDFTSYLLYVVIQKNINHRDLKLFDITNIIDTFYLYTLTFFKIFIIYI